MSREQAETLEQLACLGLVETLVPLAIGLESLGNERDQSFSFYGKGDSFGRVDGQGCS